MDSMSEPAVLPRPLRSASHAATDRSRSTLRILALAATATTFVLIGIGALVRATDSGLGCTGWPKCTDTSWLPPLRFHALIEYSHRFTAFVDVVLAVALAVVAARRFREVPRVYRPALAAVGLVVFQAILGGVVVHGELEALLVSAHLVTAMLFAGVLVSATVAAFSLDATPREGGGLRRRAEVAAGATLALIGVGAYVRGEGAGLVFTDWPLFGGRAVPGTWTVPAALQFGHRVLAGVVLALVVALAIRARREAPGSAAATLAAVAAVLVGAQILIGAANVWSRLADPSVVAHVTVASLSWGALVGAASSARLVAPRPAGAPS
jgi:heme a synthase